MLDGIHFNIPKEAVTNSDVLEFQPYGDRERCVYRGFTIDLYKHTCSIKGSIHKYHNKGKHNYNDFCLSAFIDAISQLCKDFNIEPQTIPISRIEIGVNIDIGINIREFLSYITLFKNNVPIQNSKGVTFQLSDYDVKLYKKELKGHKPKLRFEIAIKKTRKRKEIINGYATYCNTLADLMNSDVWQAFADKLASTFNDILIIDKAGIDYSRLTKRETELLTKGVSPHYWLKEWRSRATKNRHLKKLESISANKSNRTLKKGIHSQIKVKTKELIDVQAKPIYESNFYVRINNKEKVYFIKPTYAINIKNETFSPLVKINQDIKNETFSPVDKGGNRFTLQPQNKQCKVTGLNLDIGIKQNDVLSTKGVGYYYQYHRDIYNKILYPRLSERMKSKPLKKQFEAIAHSLRNERSNPRNNLRRDLRNLEQGVNMLFCYTDMLRSDKKNIYKRELYRAVTQQH